MGGALDYQWTASQVSPSIYLYREASFVFWQRGGRGGVVREESSEFLTCISPTLTPLTSAYDQHERIRNCGACASDPKHSSPYQSNYYFNQICMIWPGFCVEVILNNAM